MKKNLTKVIPERSSAEANNLSKVVQDKALFKQLTENFNKIQSTWNSMANLIPKDEVLNETSNGSIIDDIDIPTEVG